MSVDLGTRTRLSSLIACPVCKGPLAFTSTQLECRGCRASYPVADGIPRLLPPQRPASFDRNLVRIKSREEAGRTLRAHARLDCGFLTRPRHFYGFYALLVLAVGLRLPLFLAPVAAVLLADWLLYRSRRRRALRDYERSPMRARTASDFEALDRLYEEREMLRDRRQSSAPAGVETPSARSDRPSR
jgi:uncharacterized protein YbaR (Trm112 family)